MAAANALPFAVVMFSLFTESMVPAKGASSGNAVAASRLRHDCAEAESPTLGNRM